MKNNITQYDAHEKSTFVDKSIIAEMAGAVALLDYTVITAEDGEFTNYFLYSYKNDHKGKCSIVFTKNIDERKNDILKNADSWFVTGDDGVRKNLLVLK